MRRCLISAIVVLVFLGASLNGDAQDSPEMEVSTATRDGEPEVDTQHAVYNFLKVYVVGNTLIHQYYMPTEGENGETEVTHHKTYTNLTQSADTLGFDVFSVITRSHYQLDPDGMRLQETRSLLQREVSLTRYTVHKDVNTHLLFGDTKCLSHTSTELIGRVSTLQARFEEDTLTLIASTPLHPESIDEDSTFLPGVHVSVQDFRVEGQELLSRSRSEKLSLDTKTLALTGQDREAAPIVWRVERSKRQSSEPTDMITKTISEKEDLLLAEIAKPKGETEPVFLIRVDEYLYPCEIEGGLLESFPLQADVKTYHHDTSLRTFFYELFLPSEVDVEVTEMEIFNDAQWKPVGRFHWDDDLVGYILGESDTTSERKPYAFDQIRFKVSAPQPSDDKPETD